MSGHSKWAQIKHQKGTADAKKSKVFAKLAHTIFIAGKNGKDPAMNPSLREAISKAREMNMPSDNIQRAIKRGTGELKEGGFMEEVLYEFFGPGGCAVLIEGITDNKNRTLGEIRHILSKHELQLAGTGSCLWAFEKTSEGWNPKHTIKISKEDREKLKNLLEKIDELEDVQDITTNCEILNYDNFGH
ncbi:MAG: YebC/PmpR family DNA-binding transcriptional regulator [Candidatus Tagabacteria bacterium CG_4_10_14_0_2_um_filter_40_13]|uniref:YebC/PmpR family DNA-binding transcriptional regulator n=1 Tax=Candidatus Tagabacteria bacterium CG03_land_8_20_14_0_80_41_22 TaxID=1975020 RepID=A0A2M7B8G7_9BACT|nr:MAG: YebC/PmpR family DNA-binding transcriptional regulator [Candidatus Tagabacteria bacterium CG03_land_8_20_14_0_80_41_22]PIZ56190.1 MAG: YebC/PmpR family DNA-binding transcriptional regulator [Candidatus Tagabacteria bacterium CG_4_10_14_0_2_um_filter_40_13]